MSKKTELIMRSAVSAILSEPSEASSMAFPDYGQTSADHRRGLLMIVPVGSKLNSTTFGRVRDRIASVSKVSVDPGAKDPGSNPPAGLGPPGVGPDLNNSDGAPPRNFRVRYTNSHPLENNEWGEFQMHRNLIGLICIGGYSSPQELCELSRLHDVAKARYSKSLLDTRLVAIGVDSENDQNGKNNGETDGSFRLNGADDGDGLSLPDLETNQTSLTNGQSATTTVCFYQSKDFEDAVETDIVDFITGLFWILESKRREFLKSSNNNDKLPFYCAPFEKKDFVGLDLESRSNKKRTYGRFRKHLGDLCLLCDLPSESWSHYETAMEILRSCNDWIWLAGATEGLCSISVMVVYPSLNKRPIFATRNPSFDTFSSLKKKISFDEVPLPLAPSKALKGSEIIDKYKECVVHYSKYRHAGVIETEASIKAVRVLTEQCNYLLAAEFLQNIVFINLQMNDEEKIHRFSALADLYRDIGFKRKAAFFLRVAAMRCVAPNNPHPDWALCYNLLLKANAGYCIQLSNTLALNPTFNGWPALQIQLMQEMVGTARRMGNHAIATRHMTYLLEVMFDHCSDTEKTDFSSQLSVLTSRHPGTDFPLTLDSGVGGIILPPVPLYKIPRVVSFSVCPLPSHLVPHLKLGHSKGKESVFVFTPINFGGPEEKKKANFQWVANDVAEVCLTLYNPLPVELKVVGLSLLHEGVAFENFPSTLSLAPNSGPHSVSLLGAPKEPGELKILGYTLNVLGVQSTCKLRGPKGQAIDYQIAVLPSLPQLDCIITQKGQGSNQGPNQTPGLPLNQDEMIKMYLGESASFECVLTNVSGNIKVDGAKISISTHPYYLQDMITLNDSEISENTPMEPGESKSFSIDICALKLLVNTPVFSTLDRDQQQVDLEQGGGPSSISSTISRTEPSRWSGRSEGNASNLQQQPSSKSSSAKRPNFVTFEIKISYSGGQGGEKGHCRHLIRQLKVDISHSALVSKWDILPSEVPHENYLVLDISNQSIHEMEIEYGPARKMISIEPLDDCRIPVTVAKFPLKSNDNSLKARQKACLQHLEETLHIKWNLPRLDTRGGYVSLRDIKLDDTMISSLELCPLTWTMTVNGIEPTSLGQKLPNLIVGHEICVEMSVINQFNYPITAFFKVQVLLEDQTLNFPDAMVAVSQPESGRMVCRPEQQINHALVILPLTSGVYDVICSCSIVKIDNDNTDSSVAENNDFVSNYPKIKLHINDN